MKSARGNGQHSALELEILKEMAEALGRAGERLARAIHDYRALEAAASDAAADHARRLAEQRRHVLQAREWLVIQREAIGLRTHDVLDAHYPLPFQSPAEL